MNQLDRLYKEAIQNRSAAAWDVPEKHRNDPTWNYGIEDEDPYGYRETENDRQKQQQRQREFEEREKYDIEDPRRYW